MIEVRPVSATRDILGEGPVWDIATGTLHWVDIRAPAVHRLDPADGTQQSWLMPDVVGALALRERGGLLVALRTGLSFFDPASGTFTEVARLAAAGEGHRFNDGKCDPRGRFWVGSMHDREPAPVGSLYCLEPDGTCTPRLGGIAIPNSLAWSPDGSVMYFADSPTRVIYAFAFDLASGQLGERRVFATITEGSGVPDGSTVDAEGFLWNAEHGGARLVRYAPDGRIDRIVPLPVSQPTCCGFGGADLRTLYVTSASEGLSAADLEREPLAGRLFAIDVGVRGLPQARFAG
jgi:sugar lactone lactonase YvrE